MEKVLSSHTVPASVEVNSCCSLYAKTTSNDVSSLVPTSTLDTNDPISSSVWRVGTNTGFGIQRFEFGSHFSTYRVLVLI